MSTGIGSESSDSARQDCAHLDEDAECLEDPVHCGDARHQHDAHAAGAMTPSADVAGAAAGEPGPAIVAPGGPAPLELRSVATADGDVYLRYRV